MRLAQSIAIATILALCFARTTSAGVTFYVQDQPGFLAATASASLTLAGTEGFEASNLAPNSIANLNDPLVPGVANGTFSTGTQPSSGVAVWSNTLGGNATALSPRGAIGLSTASAGFLGTLTDQVSSNGAGDSFDLTFAPASGSPARAICMAPLYFDAAATGPSSHPGNLTIKVYAADQTTLLGTQTITGDYSQSAFLGIVSDGEDAIGRVNIWDGSALNYQGADDIQVWTAAPAANCRFASSVVAFSSQFESDGWSAQQALGPPNIYPDYSDNSWAWASLTQDDQAEFIQLAFDDPAPINFVNVYETYLPGAINSISVKNPNTEAFEVVWTGIAAPAPEVSRLFTATFPETPYPVSEVRIDLDSPAVPGWNEIDAVSIGFSDRMAQSQWASSVVAFSSEYPPGFGFDTPYVLGPPDRYPSYGDLSSVWASLTADDQPEFLELGFSNPAPISFVSVVETYNPGALSKVSVKNPNTGLFEEVWSGTAAPAPPESRILTVSFPETRFLVSEVRLDFDSPAVPNWNEIDAVAIGRCGCQTSLVDAPHRPSPRAMHTVESARPNPFTRSMGLGFSLGREAQVKADVFSVLGQRVTGLMDRRLPAGRHEVQWDGRDALGRATASGVYYVRVEIDGVQQSRKIVKVD